MPTSAPRHPSLSQERTLEKTVSNEISKIMHLNPKAIHSEMDMLPHIRAGLSFKKLTDICHELKLTQQDLSRSLGLNTRTLARRKKEQKLDTQESDRLYRLVSIYALAIVVLENKDFALNWLSTPKTLLGGEIPLSLLDTEVGSREVEKLLNRIEHGIYS